MTIKHLYLFLVFCIIFVVSYYVAYFILFNVKTSKGLLIEEVQEKIILNKDVMGKTIKEFDYSKKYDLLFLGSSHCYRGFDPAIFEEYNLESYNLGSSSQTPLNSYVILKKFIKHTKHVILEVYPVASNISGNESFFNCVSSDIKDYKMLLEMALEINEMRAYNILSLKPLIDIHNSEKPYNITSSYKGYVERSDSVKIKGEYSKYKLDHKNINRQLDYIVKIIDLCEKSDVKLSFVYAPIPSQLKIENKEFFIQQISQLALKENIDFYNFESYAQLNDYHHFYDEDHLNVAGVKLFNNQLISEIVRKSCIYL